MDIDPIVARVLAAAFLLELHRRAVNERRWKSARIALQVRIKLLRDLRQYKGFES